MTHGSKLQTSPALVPARPPLEVGEVLVYRLTNHASVCAQYCVTVLDARVHLVGPHVKIVRVDERKANGAKRDATAMRRLSNLYREVCPEKAP